MLIFFLLFLSVMAKAQEINNFIIYYSNKASESDFSNYSLIIFDSNSHPEFKALKEDGKIILARINIGKINKNCWYFNRFQNDKIFIKESIYSSESYNVDIRSRKWINFILEDLIPWILQKKFDGILVDSLDCAIDLERLDSKKFNGMKESAVHIVQAIRHNFPQIKIMLNKAYKLIPELESSIDYELCEGIYTNYNFNTKKYFYVDQDEYQKRVKELHLLMNNSPKLKVFTLDYWYPHQLNQIKQIYKKEYENNFIPYVSGIKLNKIISKPE